MSGNSCGIAEAENNEWPKTAGQLASLSNFNSLGTGFKKSSIQANEKEPAKRALCITPGSSSPFRGLASQGSQKSIKSHSSIQLYGRSLDVEQPECTYLEPTRALHPRARSFGETFLLCVYTQKDQYVFLRTALYNNVQDVIKQIFIKTQRCLDDESDFVLMEELRDQQAEPNKVGESSKSAEKPFYRILDQDENVWKAQKRWNKRAGRFMLEKRDIAQLYEKQNSKNDAIKTTRKISLSNMRSINLTRRISKAFTIDASKKDGS